MTPSVVDHTPVEGIRPIFDGNIKVNMLMYGCYLSTLIDHHLVYLQFNFGTFAPSFTLTLKEITHM